MNIVLRSFLLLGAMLTLIACGTSASPAPSTAPSSAVQASQAAVIERCIESPKPFDANTVDLTGSWAGDDGGVYYLRQLGSVVWWSGMDQGGLPSQIGRDFNNVARGELKGLDLDVEWSDVPRGLIRDDGTMSLKVEDDGTGNVRIVKVSEASGDFGGKVLTPCTTG